MNTIQKNGNIWGKVYSSNNRVNSETLLSIPVKKRGGRKLGAKNKIKKMAEIIKPNEIVKITIPIEPPVVPKKIVKEDTFTRINDVIFLTKKHCAKQANKFTTLIDFEKYSTAEYRTAKRNGWLDEIFHPTNHTPVKAEVV